MRTTSNGSSRFESSARFFRDPESWALLQARVISPLLERVKPDEQIRVWVPGCATGEDAYTVAILFAEEAERRRIAGNHVLIFATDSDARAIRAAREGLFRSGIRADVRESRLERFFHQEAGHFRAHSEARDPIVFAVHDLLHDPPFSNLHLICCRNVVAHMDQHSRRRVMESFRYALREDGFLFLGAAEAADEGLLLPIDTTHRLFAPRPLSRVPLPDLLASAATRAQEYGRNVPQDEQATGSTSDGQLAGAALQAKNQELQSLNEEYRCTAEELERSKEELQTVNRELQTKLEEYLQVNSELHELMGAIGVPILLLDAQLRIKRFTPEIGSLFNVRPTDCERPIGDLTHVLDFVTLEQDARRVLADSMPIERAVNSHDGHAYLARLSAYRAAKAQKTAGVVITFIDVSVVKAALAAPRASRSSAQPESTVTAGHRSQTAAP